ncbi:DUF1447 family protein [Tuanshanicoccus lijuaniae]|uniref:DNA-directed RNA polymerase subunit epsilon n=1 Tax=Aerococcaceae bacterium zg-1292 TaxID=2774330 RepID=UPI001935695D|nr:DUF1447 family protein [Aerococcaceae bacterium zg-1292]MBF6626021.1 DUF1447 family protein [Aerococcaceae bacterium zg-BR9]MBF6978889.1 DUF1447 family protein [Aerococcaceae bacterium zg-BR22]MBS4455323.1 DUF1447 family protein [Aerococcaceae bacterium zg-A91]MBS4457283.1 DUF1447 family protein [Aerococcaceae bacterium zg-BR33]
MIFKATYQETKTQVPLRENTKSLYIKADSKVEAREKFDQNTPYSIEYLQEISEAHLEYEREHNPDFEILEF